MNNKKEPENKVNNLPIFMSIGISVGMAIGAAFDNIPIGMCIGVAIGVSIGSLLDARNHKTADDGSTPEDKGEE